VSLPAAAVWHDIECGAYKADFPLWRELVAAAIERSGRACELLEIGCGTGRVSLALAGDHCRVTAVDVDSELVAVVRKQAGELGLPVDAVVADARSLELRSSFDLILAPQQFVQLFGEDDRVRVLSSIARHLRSVGCAAVALLDLDEEWDSDADPLPPPDRLRKDGWDYSSQPVAVLRMPDETTLKLDRVRRVVSPDGEQTETFSRICLELISVPQLESEAGHAGLVSDGRRQIPATDMHVASTVVLLRHPDD
jgi:SAM-dependent methyltransferase